MKGVSAIIATILMLVITIGLAGTAYVYISGMLTGKTAKTISLIDGDCHAIGGGTCTVAPCQADVVIANDGTADITGGACGVGDLIDYVDNQQVGLCCNWAIPSHETRVCSIQSALLTPGAAHTIMIVSPTNSARINVQC